jgi:methionyl-tRNA formyltransferase
MKIYALSTLFSGNEMIRQLLDKGVRIDGVIGLSPGLAGANVSGYESPIELCHRYDVKFIALDSYAMKEPADQLKLKILDIDVVLILGWQRLVPEWFIKLCKIGAIGVHGSAYGITSGRGRSPQNWALIFGKKEFHLSIFYADVGVDSGSVIDSQLIPLSEWDDIRTSHLKIGRTTVELIFRNLTSGRILAKDCARQEGSVRYLPQRKPEDGEIDWSRSSLDLYNFVRALTRPYPGAYSKFKGGILRIWRGRPFTDLLIDPGHVLPGLIVDRFESGELLVSTGDGYFYIDDYEINVEGSCLMRGDILESCSFTSQMCLIANRHIVKFPEMPLADDLTKYIDRSNE